MLPQEIVRLKRDKIELPPAQLLEFVAGITDGSVSDAQISAFAMAVYFNGLSRNETIALTMAMRDSGDRLDWSDLDRPVADKHSTGGVGDNVSVMLAPIVAACGVAVPMISGRGLGHTGGTLDKMDSIPGYTSQPDNELFRKVTREVGCAIIGQTANLAPADKRFYGVRDVTATVENVSLITASILSKKLAAGLGWLVLDVKCGNGAFMSDLQKARELARSLVDVANGARTKTTALLTDMNEPLASAIGNAVEVNNAVDFLTGAHRDPRLEAVVVALAIEMVVSAGAAADLTKAETMVRQVLDEGKAADLFGQMVTALGGPADFLEKPDNYLDKAPLIVPIKADRSGALAQVDARAVGIAVVELGGGRRQRDDTIDHCVGLTDFVPIGTKLQKGDPICFVHARTEAQVENARQNIFKAIEISETDVAPMTPVIERID
ncbi:MAG: thymidine phosphorylase [Pseudomonadota bacterium]